MTGPGSLPIVGQNGIARRLGTPGSPPGVRTAAAVPWFHVIGGARPLALVVDGSRLFAIDEALAAALRTGDRDAEVALRGLAPPMDAPATDAFAPPVALSINVAHACNLACDYCYADEGRFAGRARQMDEATALSAIDQLIEHAHAPRVVIGFIGGEPLLNRRLVHRSVAHARERAAAAGVGVGFSITTNGTLLDADDAALFRAHAFSVTVSIDGDADVHDRHRRRVGGGGSHARTLAALAPLLADPGRARVVARATVTRDDLRVAERIEPLLEAGFVEAGVSPARTGPDPALLLRAADWTPFLDEMRRAAARELDRVRALGGPIRFSNLATALGEIHRGGARALPCGAARSYVSLGADGAYYTCHRTIGRSELRLGDVTAGLDHGARRAFVEARVVDTQEPCRTCWARYLCGGGCHAEVALAGREGCDYVRGWLELCLSVYDELLETRPALFGRSTGEPS